ncbi:MAG: hypothetical protein AABN34_13515 [Acidobacteriota bacterium]
MAYTDQELLQAIRSLEARLSQILPNDQAQDLEARLQTALAHVNEPGQQPLAITQALEAIRPFPAGRDEIKAELIRQAGLRKDDGLGMKLVDIAGDGGAIKPGGRVVCPVDPTHLKKRLRIKGERCQQHNVELVEEGSLRPSAPTSEV